MLDAVLLSPHYLKSEHQYFCSVTKEKFAAFVQPALSQINEINAVNETEINQISIVNAQLIKKFHLFKEQMIAIDKKAYYEVLSYFILLQALAYYNGAVLCRDNPLKQERTESYLVRCMEWMVVFENNYLTKTGFHFCDLLRQYIVQGMVELQKSSIKKDQNSQANPYLSPEELTTLVERKNQRAERFGISCQRFVIRSNSKTAFLLNYETFNLLMIEIDKIIGTKLSSQSHFLFYTNHDLGPVELLSVRFNTNSNQLELVNVSAGNSLTQYYFLLTLQTYLKNLSDVSYILQASQANLKPKEHCSQFYAYILSGILTNSSFENVKNKQYQLTQPVFYNKLSRKNESFPCLKNVQWFSITALGHKAVLLSPSYDAMYTLFKNLYNEEIAAKCCNFFMRKYNLVFGSIFDDNFQHYYEYAYHRAKMHLTPTKNNLSLSNVSERILEDDFDAKEFHKIAEELNQLKLSGSQGSDETKENKKRLISSEGIVKSSDKMKKLTERDAKVFHRATVGYCPFHEFEFLLTSIGDNQLINVFDPDKKYNPLQLALMTQKPKQTLLLLESKAEIDLKNGKGKSAKEIYDELPENTPIKQNKKIDAYFNKCL